MPLRVLVIPDKFKGTLTADEAAQAIARGWHEARPEDAVDLVPMSDGGDGFGPILGRLLNASARRITTVDAAHRPVVGTWWWDARSRTAVVESARVIGLAMLPPGRFHPFELDTFGLGKVLLFAARRGARHCLVGIGGSATNDGGFGLARALGWRFLDGDERRIESWMDLIRLRRIVPPAEIPLGRMKVTVAVDVENPLLGPRGATRIYGPQKGIRPGDVTPAEAALRQLAIEVRRELGRDFAKLPGAGAAGGLGFGLFAFAGASSRPGIEVFSKRAGLERRLDRYDLVLTGEGSLDRSTLMGKGVGAVARLCQRRGLRCIGLSGVVADRGQLLRRFHDVRSICPGLATPAAAKAAAGKWLTLLARRTAREFLET